MPNNGQPAFDPFQIFEVTHRQCAVLTVKVIRGRKITKGWAADLVDTPDPYLILTVANSPQSWRKTTVKDNDVNPVWDETFTFWLDQEQEHVLEMSLMDANYTVDEHLATRSLPLKPLPVGKKIKTTINFNETSEVDLEISAEINDHPDLRYSLTLCQEEKNFLEARKRKIHRIMKEYFGFASPRNYREVPVIAVIGSGGGFRAMTGYSGVMSALSELGVLDMATYVGGLSGSAWYISQLYSHPEWPIVSPREQREEIKTRIDHSFLWLFKSHGLAFAREVWKKRTRGEPVSFTDLFGHLVGNTLMSDRLDSKLSDQRRVVNDGQCPLPLYTCLHVKKSVSAMIFHEWMEFSPYEVGLPKYGTFINVEKFACKFFMGLIIRPFPEPPLHFLQGIWGSAFCIQFKRLLQDDKNVDSKELMRREREELVDELQKDIDSCDVNDSESSDDENPNEKGTHGVKTTGGLERKRSKSTKLKQKTFWDSMLARMLESRWFQSIELRAAQVFNFMRGLSLNNVYPFSPFTQTQEEDENNKSTFGSIFDMHPTHIKKLYVVDSGLTFNSPFPVVLRPQREVDIILSFDFSARPSDDHPPFKELLLAEKWAELNKVPFPPIDPTVMEREGLKECYVFKHPWDPNCPIVLHFPLVNINFKMETKPGTPRTTKEETDFGNFSIFDDPARPYSTFKFTYTGQEFDRLSKLMEYNTLLSKDTIYDNISTCIKRRRRFSIRRPCKAKDIARLSLNSREKAKKLEEYIAMVETVNKMSDQTGTDSVEPSSPKTSRAAIKLRPASSTLETKEAHNVEDYDQDEIKNTKLQRSAVSLKANMNRRRPRKKMNLASNMDQVLEEEDGASSSSESQPATTDLSPRTRNKSPLTRGRHVSASMKPRNSQDLGRSKSPRVALDKDDKSKKPPLPPTNGGRKSQTNGHDIESDDQCQSDSDCEPLSPIPVPKDLNAGLSGDNSPTPKSVSPVPPAREQSKRNGTIIMKPLEEWIDSEQRVTDL